MIHVHNLPDTVTLIDDPLIYREVTSYLLYCRMELLEYEDEEDVNDHDFNFSVLQDTDDLRMLDELGPPEETVQINLKIDGMVQTIYRIVYVTTVVFIPADLSDQIPFQAASTPPHRSKSPRYRNKTGHFEASPSKPCPYWPSFIRQQNL